MNKNLDKALVGICILVFIIILYACKSNAYNVNVYDISYDRDSVLVEIVDDCEFSHKLLISKDIFNVNTVYSWYKRLLIEGKYNKCLNNVD